MSNEIGLNKNKIVDVLKGKAEIDDKLAEAIADVIEQNNKKLAEDIPVFLAKHSKMEARKKGIIY